MSAGHVEPEWALATVAFVDIRGFTTFADRATAREAAAYLTGFFEVAVPVVAAHGGVVNKLLGDGLLALFGAPERAADHADRAVSAARALVAAVETSLDERYRIGVGINSGLVLVGTMGAGGVRGLEVVGDPVNVAARVEAATKELGEPVLLTEATCALLEDANVVPRGEIRLRGKAKPVRVFGLAADAVTISGRPGRTTRS
jgi:class 3 adenylate cyclase